MSCLTLPCFSLFLFWSWSLPAVFSATLVHRRAAGYVGMKYATVIEFWFQFDSVFKNVALRHACWMGSVCWRLADIYGRRCGIQVCSTVTTCRCSSRWATPQSPRVPPSRRRSVLPLNRSSRSTTRRIARDLTATFKAVIRALAKVPDCVLDVP